MDEQTEQTPAVEAPNRPIKTVKGTLAAIRALGMTANHTDTGYVVNYRRNDPRFKGNVSSYETTDSADALATAQSLAAVVTLQNNETGETKTL